jgi:DNA-binding transcriptional MocR family regulator
VPARRPLSPHCSAVSPSPFDTVLTEALTYPGFRAAAALFGLAVVGIAMDQHGVIPDALATACQQHKPRLAYVTPAIHNPTTASMTASRRKQVAAVIEKANVVLIEDDAYGQLDPEQATLASLIPERTYLAASLSKCIAPGLRVSLVAAPDAGAAARLAAALGATIQMSTPLTAALTHRWLRDGSADTIIAAIRTEAAVRQKLAVRALAGYRFAAHPCGHHLWVPLPASWSRAEFISHVERRGLAVVSSDAFSTIPEAPHAIRVSLGAVPGRAELVRGLDIIAAALGNAPAATQVI